MAAAAGGDVGAAAGSGLFDEIEETLEKHEKEIQRL